MNSIMIVKLQENEEKYWIISPKIEGDMMKQVLNIYEEIKERYPDMPRYDRLRMMETEIQRLGLECKFLANSEEVVHLNLD